MSLMRAWEVFVREDTLVSEMHKVARLLDPVLIVLALIFVCTSNMSIYLSP